MNLEYYFERVIRTKSFYVVIEPTGVFFFTRKRYNEKLLDVCRQFASALAINDEEWMLICLVKSESAEQVGDNIKDFSFDDSMLYKAHIDLDESNIELFARAVVGRRRLCLTQNDILEIADCYMDEEITPTEIEERFMKLGISFETAHNIYIKRPQSLQEVSDCGCPAKYVEDVYKIMQEFYESISINQDSLSDADYLEQIRKSANKYFIAAALCMSVAVGCLAYNYFGLIFGKYVNVGACVFSVLGCVLATKSTNIMKWFRSALVFFMCLLLFMYWVYPYVYSFSVNFVTNFMEALDNELGKTQAFWDDLHW